MELKLYNTMERRVLPFEPIHPGRVGMYACGPTVYNFAHIGNLRTYIFEDILRRTLTLAGFQVNHVMNVTDVGHLTSDGDEGEDKMIRSAREKGMSVWDIARFFTEAFFRDTEKLNIHRPHTVCRATEHIQDMIQLIQGLEAKGYAYESGGNVYFDVSRFPDYGRLGGLDEVDDPGSSRVELDSAKRNPRDFVLWFTRSKFEDQAMVWDSPWGRGYPGWHIECSAMSMKYLGEEIDIHCGGIDHVSVHHTNEIAQSEAFTGKKWVKYWVHGEFLVLEKEKMSKSSGKFLTLEALEKQGYQALDYRFFCLGAHYRSPLVFHDEALEGARRSRRNLMDRIRDWAGTKASEGIDHPRLLEIQEAFRSALFQDLNTPQALAQLWALVKAESLPTDQAVALLLEMDSILGLELEQALQVREQAIPQEVQELFEQRQKARQEKDWTRADLLRQELLERGYLIKDSAGGSVLEARRDE